MLQIVIAHVTAYCQFAFENSRIMLQEQDLWHRLLSTKLNDVGEKCSSQLKNTELRTAPRRIVKRGLEVHALEDKLALPTIHIILLEGITLSYPHRLNFHSPPLAEHIESDDSHYQFYLKPDNRK